MSCLRTQHNLSELKKTPTTKATRTPANNRFNKQNNSCARALLIFVHFFPVLCKNKIEMTKYCVVCATRTTTAIFSYFHLELNAVIAYLAWPRFYNHWSYCTERMQRIANFAGTIMYLLTEWEGRTGKYLARVRSLRPDREPNIFPSGPTLLSQ